MLRAIRLIPVLMLIVLTLGACRPIQAPAGQAAPPATLVPTPVPTPVASPSPAPLPQLERQSGKISSNALAGNLLGDRAQRGFYIVLPPSYAEGNKRYPVVYVLPWGTSEASMNLDLRYTLQDLLQQGAVQEMILVFPDGSNSLGGSLFRSSPTIGDYETYLTKELVDLVDKSYRTLPSADSRGVMGCSNGGDASMHMALKYPGVFSVVSASGGVYDETLATNAALASDLKDLMALPTTVRQVRNMGTPKPVAEWYIQSAAGTASDPNSPPLYLEMPFRIVDGHGEIVPEVAAKIEAHDSMHEAERYSQQPLSLRGISIQHGLQDPYNPTELVRNFDRRLTELGIDHEYTEFDTGHCAYPWDKISLQFMSDHLVFAGQ